MTPRFLTIFTGRNLLKIRQPREPEPSTINERTIADFTRLVEETETLEREWRGPARRVLEERGRGRAGRPMPVGNPIKQS